MLAVCMSFVVKAQPFISSFTPTSGPIGTTVTISGSGFGAAATDNIVYFGAVKATVTAVTGTSLEVTVPAGASYSPISVTAANLTASSSGFFTPTYVTCVSITTASTPFVAKASLTNSNNATKVVSADIDGDGKPDVVSFNNSATGVYLNTTADGANTISLAARSTLPSAGTLCYGGVVTDLDGDGKPDIALVNAANGRVNIYHNESTPGSVSFATPVVYTGYTSPQAIASGDFTGDGKPDLAIVSSTGATVSFLKNTSTSGTISFAVDGLAVSTAINPGNIVCGDFDNDGRIDFAVTNSGSSSVSVFRNTSSGTISFTAQTPVPVGNGPTGIAAGDFDVDGKTDLVVVNESANTLSFLYNTSSSGNISFTPSTFTPSGSAILAGKVAVGDLDGDNKADILVGSTGSAINAFKNGSPVGTIAFDNTPVSVSVGFATGQPVAVCINDLNGDNKPDLIDGNQNASALETFLNSLDKVSVTGISPATGVPGQEIVLTGTGLDCVQSATIGGIAATLGTKTPYTLNITAGSGNTGNIVLVTTGGTLTGPKFTFVTQPSNLTYGAGSDTTIVYGTSGLTRAPSLNDGGGGIVYTIDSGAVAGLSINTNTGQISWADNLPVDTGYVLKVTATNSAGHVSAYIKIRVIPDVPKDFSYLNTTYTTNFGSKDSSDIPDINWMGEVGKFKLTSPLPNSFSVDTTSGKVYWNDTTHVGTYTVQITATNSAGSATATITVTVKPLIPDNLTYDMVSPHTVKWGNRDTTHVATINWHGEVGDFVITDPTLNSNIAVNSTTGAIRWDTLPVGTYIIPVVARNSAGNSTPATVFTLIVEAEAPTDLKYVSPVYGTYGTAGSTTAPSVNWHGSVGTFEFTPVLPAPTGVTIDATTGIVSWPNNLAVDTFKMTIRAVNSVGNSNEDTLTLIIRPLPPTGLDYSPLEYSVPYGQAGNAAILPTLDWHGQVGTFTVSGLPASPTVPAGVGVGPTTGTLSWSNTVAVGTYNLIVSATNQGGTDTVLVKLIVYAEKPSGFAYVPPTDTVYYGKADTIPANPTINWHGDVGTYSIVSVVPAPTTGSISVVPATGRIVWTANAAVGTYTITVRATNSAGTADATYTLVIKPKPPINLAYSATTITKVYLQNGASVAPTVNWNGETGTFIAGGTNSYISINPTTGVVSFVSGLPVGTYPVYVRAQNSAGYSDTVIITIIIKPIPPTGLSYVNGGDTAIYNIADSSLAPTVNLGGGVGVYTITTPTSPEISIDPATGKIHWTGSIAVGTYTFTVSVNNGTSSTTTTFTLKVIPGAPTNFVYTPNTVTEQYGTAGTSAVPTINWHGENGTFALIGAPAGITINSTTGVITWFATLTAQTYNLRIKATNSTAPPDTAIFTLIVKPQAPTNLIYTPALATPDAGVGGSSVTPTVNWHGEKGTFTIVSVTPASPEISIVDTTGIIKWTTLLPVGSYTVDVQANNSVGSSNIATYTITVAAGAPTIVYTPDSIAVKIGTQTQSAIPVIQWNSSKTPGTITLPPGGSYPSGFVTLDATTGQLSIDASGVTSPATYSVLVLVTNWESKPGFGSYKVIVADAPTNLAYSKIQYNGVQGTAFTSVAPTVNWNGLTGVFKATGAPAGVTIDAASGVITFGSTVLAGSYTFTVEAENLLGTSNAVTIELNIVPQADATITGGTTICSGKSVDLTVSLIGTAPFSFTYNDGVNPDVTVNNITTNTYTLTVTPATTTTYTVTSVIDANTTSMVSSNTTVTVNAGPAATINGGTAIPACLGTSTVLTANAGTFTYLWSTGATTNTLNVTTSGTYSVTVTDANGCSSKSADAVVNLNTIPTVAINKTGISRLICEGTSRAITATGGSMYNWYKDNVLITDSVSATLYVSAEGIYKVEAVSAAGCTSNNFDTISLSFAKKPTADFSYDTYCKDVDMNFVNNSDEGGGEVSYKWVFDADNASTEKEPVFAYSTSGGKTITLTVTSLACPNLSDTKTVTLTVEEPTPSKRYDPINGILGRTVNLEAKATGTSYSWTPATNLSSATIANPVLTMKDSATYYVTVSTDAGCLTVDTQQVRIFKGADIYVPKAFTPNGDGINDKLFPIPVGVPQLTYFRVFNRWGVILYQINHMPSVGEGWDGTYKGKEQPFDSYTWVAEGIDVDGKTVRLSGNSVLIR
ncbi:internalin [Filimonas lacunae]|nr:internalin [Filimonas lacunae]